MRQTYVAGEYKVVIYPYRMVWWKCTVVYFSGQHFYTSAPYANKEHAIQAAVGATNVPFEEWKEEPSNGEVVPTY